MCAPSTVLAGLRYQAGGQRRLWLGYQQLLYQLVADGGLVSESFPLEEPRAAAGGAVLTQLHDACPPCKCMGECSEHTPLPHPLCTQHMLTGLPQPV